MLQMEMATTPVFLPGKFHGQSLAGYSPQSHKELDMTETSQHTGMQKHHTRKHTHTHLFSRYISVKLCTYFLTFLLTHTRRSSQHFKMKQKFFSRCCTRWPMYLPRVAMAVLCSEHLWSSPTHKPRHIFKIKNKQTKNTPAESLESNKGNQEFLLKY